MASFLDSAHAEATQTDPDFMHNTVLPTKPHLNSPAALAPSDPIANYDEQLGLTFTEGFTSLAYNVTALALTDEYGIGPAYLLNGLTTAGYWYQVGVSYNWPYSSGGHVNGFYLSYNVFNSAGEVVLPSNGAGGILPFSGSVNSGDLILLSLNFSAGRVIMSAKDWNTGASASLYYSARGATTFIGLPDSPSNHNGFFSGLMTEWYHVLPYYGDMTAITYTNNAYNLSSAWMWMDEWNPANTAWSGSWFDYTFVQYNSNSSELQKLSSNGAVVFSNASMFITGSIGALGTETTTITLLPAGQSTPISSTNQFSVTYTLNSILLTTQMQNPTLTLTSDINTNIVVSATSSGSTTQEKWVFNTNNSCLSTASGTNLTAYYYNLLVQNVSYSVVGGGNPQTPLLTYTTAPFTTSAQESPQTINLLLSQTPQTIWVLRETTTSINGTITAGPSERWITQTATWNIKTPNTLPSPITYNHQFLLTVTGAQVNPQWYNNSETAQLSISGVSGRTSGVGQRVTSYTMDGGSLETVQPTTGTVRISITMNTGHQVQVNSVNQYHITLDASTVKMLSSITQPTISGDNYWYDQGTHVKLVLNGIGNRLANTGERLTEYSVNGAVTKVATAQQVNVLDTISLLSPQIISATTVNQFKLSTPSGSIESITPPPITGDSGWYDTGTLTTIMYAYSWNQTATQSRLNAVSYTITQGAPTTLDRSGNGTFPVQITITQPETISVFSVTQYLLTLVGDNAVTSSQVSPTNDAYFDSGTTLTVTTPYIKGELDKNMRQSLYAYTLDSVFFNVTRAETGNFITSTITFDRVHELAFHFTPQYRVFFQFKDNNRENTLSPSSFQVKTNESTIINVPNSSLWFDKGTSLQIHSIMWQNVEVRPTDQINYVVNMPMNETIFCRVYSGKLSVLDYFGLPVSDAQVKVTLANTTTLSLFTNSEGTVNLPMIPLGTFKAEIDYWGASTTVDADVANQNTVSANIFGSIPLLATISAVIIGFSAVTAFLFVRKRRRLST